MSCQDILSALLPSPLPCCLGGNISPSLSDISLEAGIVSYLSSNPAIACMVANRIYPGYMARANATFPAIVYEVAEVERENLLSGAAGMATATVTIDCYSNQYPDVVKLAEVIRLSLHGFRGWMGCVGVWGVWPQGQEDEVEQPQDNSGTWWYMRGLTYSIQYYEPIPSF